ncbi:3-oxoacyl-ACP reductase FabG [Streptomyces sp. NPDC002520]
MTSRSVLVTGGSRGIGLATARAFRDLGHRVAVTRMSTAAPPDLFSVPCDVTDPDQVRSAFAAVEEEHGPVEVLVSNAGITDDAMLLEMSYEQFTRVLDTNVTGSYLVVRTAVRGMLRARWGRVILVSSVSGLWGVAGQVNYAASKAALLGLARALAKEVGPYGVTANVVLPGYVETDMTASLPPGRREALLRDIAVGRPGRPEEIADAITWLAGENAGYVTGAILPVAGGLAMGL